jgi:membrane-associated protease RseP (regulator of RpoE activity)
MQASRGPWWFYVVSICFIAYFTFLICADIWGPESLGFDADYRTGAMLVKTVDPRGPSAPIGLRVGDRIVAVNGISIRRRYDFVRAWSNFEPQRPISIEIDRENKPIELVLNLKPGTLGDLEWSLAANWHWDVYPRTRTIHCYSSTLRPSGANKCLAASEHRI